MSHLHFAVSVPIQEDWGWCLIAETAGKKFTISIGIMDDSIGKSPAEWRVGVEYERAMNGILAFMRPVPIASLNATAGAVRQILIDEPEIELVPND